MQKYLFLLLTLLPFFTFGQDTNWQSFKLVDGHIHVPVTINDVDGFAVIDTGATTTGVSNHLIQQHSEKYTFGRPVPVSGIFGKRKVRPVHNVNISTLNKSINYRRILPIPTLDKEEDNVIALIGMDFLSQFVLKIDYPNSRISLAKRSTFSFEKSSNTKLIRTKYSRRPIVQLLIENSTPVTLTLDTGNSGEVVINRQILEDNELLQGVDITPTKGSGIFETMEMEYFLLSNLQIGPHKISKAGFVTVPVDKKSNFDRIHNYTGYKSRKSKIRGIVGYSLLKDFVITLDIKSNYLRLDRPSTS